MKKILLNKIVIPAILGITVLVAGIFAFMPVEKAGTVHTTIIASISDANVVGIVDSAVDFDQNEELEVTCTGGKSLLHSIIFESIGGTFTTADSMSLRFDIDGAGGNWGEVTINSDIFGSDAPADIEIMERAGIVAPIGLTSGGQVKIIFDTDGSGGTKDVRAMFVLTLDSATSCSATGTN